MYKEKTKRKETPVLLKATAAEAVRVPIETCQQLTKKKREGPVMFSLSDNKRLGLLLLLDLFSFSVQGASANE